MKVRAIENDQGQCRVRIRSFPIGDYLYSDHSNVVTWYDCRGSVAKYVALIEDLGINREELVGRIEAKLNSGEKIGEGELLEELEAFCQVFPKGDLTVTLFDEDTDFEPASGDHVRFRSWYLTFPRRVELGKEEEIKKDFRKHFDEQWEKYGWVSSDLIGFSTVSFYDAFTEYLIFTQPEADLDPAVVEHYTQEIKNGKRPYCLVYSSLISECYNNYVLDGHHKLKAYLDLQIRPAIIEIRQVTEEGYAADKEITQFTEDNFHRLYPWQLQHLFDEAIVWRGHLAQVMADPGNPFNGLVKQGLVEEFWINGQLKKRGNYIDNRAQGIVEQFYENGNPKNHLLFEDGKQIWFAKSWFPTGELQSEFIQEGEGQNGEQIIYTQEGKISERYRIQNGSRIKQ